MKKPISANADVAQVLYQGRWVKSDNFRAFVYNATGEKLANSYDEYTRLITSGLWFSKKDEVIAKEPVSISKPRKAKNGSSDS